MGVFSTLKEKMFGRLQRNISASGEHIGDLKNTFSARMEEFKAHRSADDQKRVIEDFGSLLTAWGIEDERDIPVVCDELKWRLPLFILPIVGLLGLALWQNVALAWLMFVLCATPCLFGLATTLWRISILRKRQFVPFGGWLTAFLAFK